MVNRKIHNKKNETSPQQKYRFNYWLEVAFVLAIIVSVIFDAVFFDCLQALGAQNENIVIVLLPLVVTILSITLSMPREPIYGIGNSDFRRLRGEKIYTFLEMMIYTIIIFIIFIIVSIFDLKLIIWVLDVISIVYSILFVYQEIPILIRDDKRIKKIIRDNIHRDNKTFSYDDLPYEVSMLNVLQNLLLSEGILSAYSTLKTDDRTRNQKYLDKLLSLQNDFLFEYIDNHTLVLEGLSSEYKGINILNAVDRAIKNIEDLLSFTEQLNIIAIYGDEKHFYHITRSLFSLYRILTELKFDKKYKSEFSGVLQLIFMKLSYDKSDDGSKRFLYKILNAMVVSSLSSNEIWFLELLRDSLYPSPFSIYGSTEYMVFVTQYLYYLIKVENRVPEEFKLRLTSFMDEASLGLNSKGESWLAVLKHKLKYINSEDVIELLPKLLFIYECNSNDTFGWYSPPFEGVWYSSADGRFTKQQFMSWWIGYVLTNSTVMADAFGNRADIKLPSLNEDDVVSFALELNKNWFADDQFKTGKTLPFNEFIGEKNKVEEYWTNSTFVNALKKFKHDTINELNKEEIRKHIITPELLEKHKITLSDGFKKAIQAFPILDTSIDVSSEGMKQLGILFDTRWSETLVKSYADRMPDALLKLLFDDAMKTFTDAKIKREITEYSNEILHEIISFGATTRHAYIYDYSDTDEIRNKLITEVNKIPSVEKLWIPRDSFLRDKAIAINFEYLDNESFVRKLTSNEISNIIDRDYKVINGLYQYIEGANGERSVLLSREELIKIVEDKFFYALIVFKYKTSYKTDDILYFEKKNDKN